ncbi:MAG: D-alanyl-D-alanine carboxypeptidase family protein [Bacillota bacterium]
MERTWRLWRTTPCLKETKHVLPQQDRLHEGDLILVNRSHPVKMHPAELNPLTAGMLQAITPEEPLIQLERTCLLQLSSLIDSCGRGRDITVVSGYRSREAQDLLYLNSLKEHGEEFTSRYVALPGGSEHQTGLAVDVGISRVETDYISPAFPDEGASGKFRRIASEYGFIPRYQENKTANTGIAE